jgi:hypothetical protein
MPKISWNAADEEQILTADDIDNAEDGFTDYAGDIPPGGVYRFKIKRIKFTEFNSGNQGYLVLMELDGSWKPAHRKFDGCPLWDRVTMTKAAANFAKAFAAGIGVSSADLISRTIVDEDGVVTKIGKVVPEGKLVYVSVKRGEYNGEFRLETANTGYQVVDEATEDTDADEDEAKPAKAKAKAGKAAKGGKKSKNEDDEPPF